jgi:hypothetical protein
LPPSERGTLLSLWPSDAFAAEDDPPGELVAARLLSSLDPSRAAARAARAGALEDVSGECGSERAHESFAPVVDVLAAWPGSRSEPGHAGAPVRLVVGPMRGSPGVAVVIGPDALSHGSESQLGRRLAQASAELARERACGDWWLAMATASRGQLRPGSRLTSSRRRSRPASSSDHAHGRRAPGVPGGDGQSRHTSERAPADSVRRRTAP